MAPPKYSHEIWGPLLDAAVEFKKRGPWRVIDGEVLIAIHHPQCEKTLYSVVLGGKNEVFGLAVYPGDEGLKSYMQMKSQEGCEKDLHYTMRALLVSFVDRRELADEDIEILKSLGRRFRGANAWPRFRSYEPGYVDTLPDPEEARIMEYALLATARAAKSLAREHQTSRTDSSEETILSLSRESLEDPWQIRREPLQKPSREKPVPPADEVRIQRLKKRPSSTETWESACFWIPALTKEGDKKPFFPLMAIWVDHSSGFVLEHALGTPSQGITGVLQESFLELLEKANGLPEKVMVMSDKAMQILAPITGPLGIRLKKSKKLQMLQEAVNEMMAAFSGPGDEGDLPESISPDELFDEISNIQDANEELLDLFGIWLSMSGESDDVVDRHLHYVDIYINLFLLSEDEFLSFDQGIFRLESFFSEWLPREIPGFGKDERKSIIASLTEFYTFLKESGILPEDELSTFKRTIAARKADWLRNNL